MKFVTLDNFFRAMALVAVVILGISYFQYKAKNQEKSQENPWMEFAEESPGERTLSQNRRLAEVLNKNFSEEDIPAIKRWQKEGESLNLKEMQEDMIELVPKAQEMDKIPDNKIGRAVKEIPLEGMCRMVIESSPRLGMEYLDEVTDLSRKLMYLYTQNNPEYREIFIEQWEDPVGREMAMVYYRNIEYVYKGGK